LHHTLATTPVTGILLELSASIAATANEKKTSLELMDLFPSAKFRFLDGQVLIVGMTLEEFIEVCREFKPRILRKSERKNMYFALYLSDDKTFMHEEKTVTINVSTEGYFIFSVREWQVGNRVWMRFLDDDAILAGTVRSLHPWGNNKFLPGIGIKLDS
jgi:hypothetical protein